MTEETTPPMADAESDEERQRARMATWLNDHGLPMATPEIAAWLGPFLAKLDESTAESARLEAERRAQELWEIERAEKEWRDAAPLELRRKVEGDIRNGWYVLELTETSARLHRPRRGWGPFLGFSYGEQGPDVKFRTYELAPYPRSDGHTHFDFEGPCNQCYGPRNHGHLLVWNDPPDDNDSPPRSESK